MNLTMTLQSLYRSLVSNRRHFFYTDLKLNKYRQEKVWLRNEYLYEPGVVLAEI